MAKEYIRTSEAATLLGRDIRRVQQLIQESTLEAGQFLGSVSLASVLKYKRAIERGEIRRGPKAKARGSGVVSGDMGGLASRR